MAGGCAGERVRRAHNHDEGPPARIPPMSPMSSGQLPSWLPAQQAPAGPQYAHGMIARTTIPRAQ